MSKGSELELVADSLGSRGTRTKADARREFAYSHPDLLPNECTPEQRIEEERALLIDELDSFLSPPLPDDGRAYVLVDINDHVALAIQSEQLGSTLEIAAMEADRFTSLENRLAVASTAAQIGILISEAKHMGVTLAGDRPRCADFLRKCFEKRAAAAGAASGAAAAGGERAQPVKRGALEPICGYVFDAIGGDSVFAYPQDLWPSKDKADARPPAAKKEPRATVYAANTHATVHPKWAPSWLSFPPSRGRLALNQGYVALADTLDGGNKLRLRVWKTQHLLCKRAKPPVLSIECTIPPLLGPIRSAAVDARGTHCAAIFDTCVIVATPKKTVALHAHASTLPVFTCGLFVVGAPQFIRLGTRAGIIYSIDWTTAHIRCVQPVTDVTPVLALRGIGHCQNYVAHTASDVQIIREHADAAPYQVHVGIVMGASACGALLASMSDSGMISIGNCHLTGTYRQLIPPKSIVTTDAQPLLSAWTDEPRDTAALAAADGIEPATDNAEGALSKAPAWRLKTPARYFYSSVYMHRDTVWCMYPDGTIRTLKISNTK